MLVDRVFAERGVSGSKPMAERPEGAALLAVPGKASLVPAGLEGHPGKVGTGERAQR
jgi:hypothetical protein